MIDFKKINDEHLSTIRTFVKATILKVDSLGEFEKPIKSLRELLLIQLERIEAYELIPFDDFPSELLDTESRAFCVTCELINRELLGLVSKICEQEN